MTVNAVGLSSLTTKNSEFQHVHMEQIVKSLDVTDRFLQFVIQDENRLRDAKFMQFLSEIRLDHKRTMAVFDKLRDQIQSKTTSEFMTDVNDYCHNVQLANCRSKSMGALNCLKQQCDQNGNDLHYYADPLSTIDHYGSQSLKQHSKWMAGSDTALDYLSDDNHPNGAILDKFVPQQTHVFTQHNTLQISVPQHFQVMLGDRDSTFKLNSHSQRCLKELIEQREAEMNDENESFRVNRFRAHRVPPSTYEPRYEMLQMQQELVGSFSFFVQVIFSRKTEKKKEISAFAVSL
ncbi:hypothetical protein AB6A40_008224 [Gnathostoma spinigerum]|uniref:Uncharacterized protein n=1 Tax=Gnathostoma spinigerum TaxID=75299 RepID=A0ABD6ENG4_9BILA